MIFFIFFSLLNNIVFNWNCFLMEKKHIFLIKMKLSWFEWVCSFPVDCTKNEQHASRGSRKSWLISTKSRFVVCIWYEITEWIPIRLLRHSQVLWQNLFQLYGDRMSLWVAVIVFAIWPMVWIDMGQIIIITICLFTCISFQLFKYPMLSISMRRPGVYLWKTFSDNHRHFYFIAFSSEFHRIVFICSIISVLNLIQAFTSCVLQIFCKMIVVVVVVLGCVLLAQQRSWNVQCSLALLPK